MGFDELVPPDPRIRQTEVARHRKVDSGDNMLQLHVKNAFPIRDKVWEVFQRFVSPSVCPCCPLIPSNFSLEAVNKICVASHSRRLPDAHTADLPTSHRGVRMPLSRRSVDDL